MPRQVVLGINLGLNGINWDKQFYLELAQLLPQQLSTLISRFLHKGKVEFGNLLSWDSLCYLILTAGAGEVLSTHQKEKEKPQVPRKFGQEKEKVKPQVLLSGDRRPVIPWPLNLDWRTTMRPRYGPRIKCQRHIDAGKTMGTAFQNLTTHFSFPGNLFLTNRLQLFVSN